MTLENVVLSWYGRFGMNSTVFLSLVALKDDEGWDIASFATVNFGSALVFC